MQCKMCELQKNITNAPYFVMELETGYVILGWYQRFNWHLYPRVKGDTPMVSSVYQLPNSVLFDESTRPSDVVRKDYINKIKNEIERLLAV